MGRSCSSSLPCCKSWTAGMLNFFVFVFLKNLLFHWNVSFVQKVEQRRALFTCKPEWSTQAIFMCQILCENSYLLVSTRKTGQFLCGKYIHWKPSVLAFISQILVMQCFRVVYHEISHESLVFTRYTHKLLLCIPENTSDKLDV